MGLFSIAPLRKTNMGFVERSTSMPEEARDQSPRPVEPTPPAPTVDTASTSSTTTRRGLLGILGGLAGGLAAAAVFGGPSRSASAESSPANTLPSWAINTENNPDKIRDLTATMIRKVNALFQNDFDAKVSAVGYRISNAWKDPSGTVRMAEQGAIWELFPDGRFGILNALDEAHKLGLDQRLDDGSLGVTIPPHEDFDDRSNGDLEKAFAARVDHFDVPQDVADFVSSFRRVFETGAFTSRGKPYGGAYEVWRTQRMAFQKWLDGEKKGVIERILAGDAMKAAGLIPQEVLLPSPDLGPGGPETPPVTEVKLTPIDRIEASQGRVVEFLEYPGNPIGVKVVDKETLKKIIDKYTQPGKQVQVVFAPQGTEVEGLKTNGGFSSRWITFEGQVVSFGLSSGIEWSTIPARVLVTPFTSPGGTPAIKDPYDVMNYIYTDPSWNLEVNGATSLNLAYFIAWAGRGFNPGSGSRPEIEALWDSPSPPIQIYKKA